MCLIVKNRSVVDYVAFGFVGFRDEYHVGLFKSIGKIAGGQ